LIISTLARVRNFAIKAHDQRVIRCIRNEDCASLHGHVRRFPQREITKAQIQLLLLRIDAGALVLYAKAHRGPQIQWRLM
jgi:hypothetical protein